MMPSLSALLALAVMPALSFVSLASSQSGATLASLRHDYRPLLVFAASNGEQVREQMDEFSTQTHLQAMQERQVVVVPILLDVLRDGGEDQKQWHEWLPEQAVVRLEAGEERAARRRFHVGEGDFTVILIGKDGGEKLRSKTPVTMERLIKVIDAMPMRQKEARDGHSE